MKRIFALAALIAGTAAGLPAAAQTDAGGASEEAVLAQYARIDASVIRIRTTARLENRIALADNGLTSASRSPLTIYGTGVVIGTVEVDGNTEYLILTNHHVADASNYVIQDGRFLRENKRNTRAVPVDPEESYVVTDEHDEVGPDDIRVIELARNVRGDMALLRTVGARRALVPFEGRIGYRAGEVESGAKIVTSGYPFTGGKVHAVGSVLDVHRPHDLGVPHVDFTVDLPVERGQSGSPVFEVTEEDGTLRYTLIGLIHAAEHGEKYMVPFELWQESLGGVRHLLAGRLPG